MKIAGLKKRPEAETNEKLRETYLQFEKLLNELEKRELTDNIIVSINKEINGLNAIPGSDKNLRKQITKVQADIIKLVEKELKLVPKNYYRNLWLAIGLAVFGLPVGVIIGLTLHNMAFLGIGLPMGLAVGIAIGTGMDKKAQEEGRQLDIELKN